MFQAYNMWNLILVWWALIPCSLVEMCRNFGRISVNIQSTVLHKTPEDSIF